MPTDASLLGTYRETAHVAAYRNERIGPDGLPLDDDPPDQVILIEHFYESDGTVVTDPARIEAIRAAQAAQGLEHPHERPDG